MFFSSITILEGVGRIWGAIAHVKGALHLPHFEPYGPDKELIDLVLFGPCQRRKPRPSKNITGVNDRSPSAGTPKF